MSNPDGSKQRASFASRQNSTLLILIERKQKEWVRGRKTSRKFSETTSTATSAKDSNGIILKALSNKKKFHEMNDKLCSLPNVGDINIQFDRPEALLQAVKPINNSFFPYPRLKKLPRSGVNISHHDDHENETNNTHHEASNAFNQPFSLQLVKIVESRNNETLSNPKRQIVQFYPRHKSEESD
ncbi:uncharacterized protein N7483_010757 [Penicillium malachiteum]|uniref:uncharacterized protein n=1 Tax=Penicillium malachiteum TaxID=1324776 RepID=UPI0025498DDC|nr:uncharacterized protein N7483_010757 [Penicillium malachiteum]KAJ5713576.1 hypothetical protein N7483_010757 [Penicillium malachiteum]